MGSLFLLPKTKQSATKKYINSFSWHWTRQMCTSILVIRCRQWSRPVMKIRQWISRPTAYACIDSQTLADLVGSMDGDQFNKRYLLVDCRYPYEYEAGHILVIYFLYHLQIINFRTQLTFMRPQQFAHSFFPRTRIHSQREVLAFRYFIANIQKSEGR